MKQLRVKMSVLLAVGVFVALMPSAVAALEWSDAPEPSGSGDVMWAEIYQTPEGASFGKITSYACGPKSQYGKNGTTGGQNIGGGDRLGTRFIYFADSCGVSQAPSNSAFNTSSYVFTLSNGFTRYAGLLVSPPTTTTTTSTTTTTTTTTSTTTSTTTTTVPKTTTTMTEPEEENTTATTKPKSKATTTTTKPADFDDGTEEDELVADIQVKKLGSNYSIRITSNQENNEMQIVARRKGQKNISWTIKTDDSGAKRISTSRNLRGFTLFLRVDGETVDTAKA